MIANEVKSQLPGSSSSGFRYTRPYSKKGLTAFACVKVINLQNVNSLTLRLKQHIAYFVKTYNNAGTEGELLVKQYVHSLKGITFDCYTNYMLSLFAAVIIWRMSFSTDSTTLDV